MKPDPEDRELQRLFALQRQQDEQAAPAFTRVMARANSRSETARPVFPVVRFATAVALLLAMGTVAVIFLRRHPRPAVQPMRTAMLITDWQSPTDELLKTPGAEWFSNVPQINESVAQIVGSESAKSE